MILHATGAMAALLKDAHQAKSDSDTGAYTGYSYMVDRLPILHMAVTVYSATKTALKLADIAITEAGFGADLGAEKFFGYQMPYGWSQSRMLLLS